MNLLVPYPTSFLGRGDEVRALTELLERGERLVTVVGGPGAGKTRLAHHVASKQQRTMPVAFVELASSRSHGEFLARVAMALDVSLEGTRDNSESTERLGLALSRRGPILLVLDNFEQLDPAATISVARFIAMARDTQIVVTSRRRLGLDDACRLDLGPLLLRDALELFSARSGTHLHVEAEDHQVLLALAERLDRLPLALELAAARATVLTPRQILAHLDDGEGRLDVLRDPRAQADGRHASLERAIAFSFDLLSEVEQICLVHAAVFVDGFDAEAAEKVLFLGDGAVRCAHLDVLDALVRSSLLHTHTRSADGGKKRFALYESVRAFAVARFEHLPSRPAVEDRFRDYFLSVGERWADAVNGREASLHRGNLRLEQANILGVHEASWPDFPDAVARSALILSPVLSSFGPPATHDAVLDRGVSASLLGAPETHIALLATRGWAALHRGDGPSAFRDITAAVALAKERQLHALEADALAKLAHFHIRTGSVELARVCVDEAIALCERHELTTIFGKVLERQGILLTLSGDLESAEHTFGRALEYHRRSGDLLWQGFSHCDRGEVRMHLGRSHLAIRDLEKALAFERQVGDRRLVGVVELCLGLLCHESSDVTAARDHFENALTAIRQVSHRKVEAEVLEALGCLELTGDNTRAAQACFAESIEILQGLGNTSGMLKGEAYLALCRALDGHVEAALETVKDLATGIAEEVGTRGLIDVIEAMLLGELAALVRGRGEQAKAAELTAQSRERLQQIECKTAQMRILVAFCRSRMRRHELAGAATDMQRPAAVVFGPECRWFRLEGVSPISLARRGVMRQLLQALVEARLRAPGAVLDAYELFDRGWPKSNAMPDVGAARVYESLRVLRNLGLRDVIVYRDGGYMLDPDLPITQAS